MADRALQVAIEARRGSFHLRVECRLTAEWTVVFGPSGAGKSTLLRLIAGLGRGSDEAVRSRIEFSGRVLTDTARRIWLRPGARGCGLVTQQAALFPHLSLANNVGFGLRGASHAERARRVDAMLELVGAAELRGLRAEDLSGGQAQRVALARALAPGPSLLLLDEPFAALDGASSDALLDRLLAWLRENSVQAVLATHDVSDALTTRAEALLLREGKMAALGPAAVVLAGERERLMGRLNV